MKIMCPGATRPEIHPCICHCQYYTCAIYFITCTFVVRPTLLIFSFINLTFFIVTSLVNYQLHTCSLQHWRWLRILWDFNVGIPTTATIKFHKYRKPNKIAFVRLNCKFIKFMLQKLVYIGHVHCSHIHVLFVGLQYIKQTTSSLTILWSTSGTVRRNLIVLYN